jgi:hypothetical protein
VAKVYLLILSGQGDTQVKIVEEETFKWVTSPDDGRSAEETLAHINSWEDKNVPASQIALMKKILGDEYEPVRLGGGSWTNDRALAAQPIEGYPDCWSIIDSLRAAKAKGDEVEDTYEGYLY